MPVASYAALPSSLTDPLAKPAPPPLNCRDRLGLPRVCALDGLMFQIDQDKVIDRCNDDRASSARITDLNSLSSRDAGSKP